MASVPWIDRVVSAVSPAWGLRRQRTRVAASLLARNYEAASVGRRTQGWNRATTDANSALGPSLAYLRQAARDVVRNNPYASSAVRTIVNHTVGWGIVAAEADTTPAWQDWATSRQCDADGRSDFAGIQKRVLAAVATDGEVLVRRRWRRLEDGYALPMQLQVLEIDFLDTAKDGRVPSGNLVIKGVEYDALGKRAAYWLFREHPGSSNSSAGSLISGSQRVSATDVVHVFKQDRPGQVRAASWFASVLLRLKDHDDLEDATLMKQKIAACLAVITSDVDGTSSPLGSTTTDSPTIDTLEPGMVINAAPGREIHVVQPPSVTDFGAYSKTVLMAIATGLGVTYEDLTGDYQNLPFSAARMSRLRHWSNVQDWRWSMLEPQLLDPVWAWAVEAAAILGIALPASTEWTAPALPLIDPDREALASQREVRSGQKTISEVIRERGYNPDRFLAECAADFKKLDALGLVLDIDPRYMTQAGQVQSLNGQPTATAPARPSDDA